MGENHAIIDVRGKCSETSQYCGHFVHCTDTKTMGA